MDLNQQIIVRYINELNKRNYSIIDEVVESEVIVGSDKITREQYRHQIMDRINQYPNYFVKINKMETKGDTVILHWHRSGTDKETGEKLDGDLISEYQLVDGRIHEVN